MAILGRPVVEARSRRALGVVTDVLLDDDCRNVVGVVVERRRIRRARLVVAFEAVRAFCADVIIASHPARSSADDPAPMTPGSGSVEGKPVVTDGGRVVGAVTDVVFDERDGRVRSFEVREWAPRRICRRRMLLPAHVPIAVGDVIIVPRDHLRVHAVARIH
jgi:uncharacterized protein YrrD